jgi:hypothetical protein
VVKVDRFLPRGAWWRKITLIGSNPAAVTNLNNTPTVSSNNNINNSIMSHTEEQLNDFAAAVTTAVKWLHENGNPHMKIIIDQSGAVLLSDEMGVPFSPPD